MKKYSTTMDLFKEPNFAMAISKYSLEPLPRGGLLFGYTGANEETILHGVKTLAAALEQL
jgi:DNA-binding transcriptional MocR family regulator